MKLHGINYNGKKFYSLDKLPYLEGFGKDYYISKDAEILSFKGRKPRILKNYEEKSEKGKWLSINFYDNGKKKNFIVSQIVARMFIPKKTYASCVTFKDGNPYNCSADNLEWTIGGKNLAITNKFIKVIKDGKVIFIGGSGCDVANRIKSLKNKKSENRSAIVRNHLKRGVPYNGLYFEEATEEEYLTFHRKRGGKHAN